jgi:hypothetical protein
VALHTSGGHLDETLREMEPNSGPNPSLPYTDRVARRNPKTEVQGIVNGCIEELYTAPRGCGSTLPGIRHSDR